MIEFYFYRLEKMIFELWGMVLLTVMTVTYLIRSIVECSVLIESPEEMTEEVRRMYS